MAGRATGQISEAQGGPEGGRGQREAGRDQRGPLGLVGEEGYHSTRLLFPPLIGATQHRRPQQGLSLGLTGGPAGNPHPVGWRGCCSRAASRAACLGGHRSRRMEGAAAAAAAAATALGCRRGEGSSSMDNFYRGLLLLLLPDCSACCEAASPGRCGLRYQNCHCLLVEGGNEEGKGCRKSQATGSTRRALRHLRMASMLRLQSLLPCRKGGERSQLRGRAVSGACKSGVA